MVVIAEIFNFGHDVNGNPTAHFTLYTADRKLLFSTKRRVQTGYCCSYSDGALYKAQTLTKQCLMLASYVGSRSEGLIRASFTLYGD